jgi:hypothetical protein
LGEGECAERKAQTSERSEAESRMHAAFLLGGNFWVLQAMVGSSIARSESWLIALPNLLKRKLGARTERELISRSGSLVVKSLSLEP